MIASPSVARQIDLDELVRSATDGRAVAIFTGTRPHVPHDVVLEAAAAARDAGADGVLSIGGGSAVDLAKAVSLCLADGIESYDQLMRWRVVFEYPDKVEISSSTNPQLPHLSVSTTLSAGEFTGIAGITDSTRKVKDLYITPALVPRAATNSRTASAAPVPGFRCAGPRCHGRSDRGVEPASGHRRGRRHRHPRACVLSTEL